MIESIGAGEGNRTLVISLEGCCSTIELHPHSEDSEQTTEGGGLCPILSSEWWGR
jgi:hypothetical protein